MNADLCGRFWLWFRQEPPAPLARDLAAFPDVAGCHPEVRAAEGGAGKRRKPEYLEHADTHTWVIAWERM